ncbi:13995_t:CDS:2, partial [Racocetra persica]
MPYVNLLKDILPRNKIYVVAVSGGPDSMFLLDNLRVGNYQIIVAHVNYHRRIDSDYDESLVRVYCQKNSLPLKVYSVKEAVAHHQQDHLETYWWQKNRQSLVDYWGLPVITQQGQFRIFRPLLSLAKEQIIQYLHEQKISYAVDSTNQLPLYQRNIFRRQITNLNITEQGELLKAIRENNQELEKMKLLVKQQKKYFCPSRLATGGLLLHRKKKLLAEIYKQLFLSPKNNLRLEGKTKTKTLFLKFIHYLCPLILAIQPGTLTTAPSKTKWPEKK